MTEQLTRLRELVEHALTIWIAGGWAMIAIAVIALVLFALGTHVYLKLQRTGFSSIAETSWRRWIEVPAERKGPIGAHLDLVTEAQSLDQMARAFQELRTSEISPYQRDLRVMKVCIGAAPLFGLLGTVTGMLATFSALAAGSGGDQTMEKIAAGISEALITTETGLVVALPGLFFHYQMTRKYERYKAFLAHMETVCTQGLFRRLARDQRDDRHTAPPPGPHGSATNVGSNGSPHVEEAALPAPRIPATILS